MIDPAWGPFLFDTSAESWLIRKATPAVEAWLLKYLDRHRIHISAITVAERMRGYSMLRTSVEPERRFAIDVARASYLSQLGEVRPLDAGTAAAAGELLALLPNPPSPPRRNHRLAESQQERLARWRFDCLIAATALVLGMPLLHNNPEDFEAIASAIERSPAHFPGLSGLHAIRCTLIV